MQTTPRIPASTATSNASRPGDPEYSLLALVAGTLLQVGTQATAYVSSFALVSHGGFMKAMPA